MTTRSTQLAAFGLDTAATLVVVGEVQPGERWIVKDIRIQNSSAGDSQIVVVLGGDTAQTCSLGIFPSVTVAHADGLFVVLNPGDQLAYYAGSASPYSRAIISGAIVPEP